ncbi:unnamed protein product [Urochloa humidicola]
MEETLEAAATVIHFLGASVVEAKCRELVVKARGVEEAAAAADVGHADLTRAAGELEKAVGEERMLLAVVNLRDASAALDGGALERAACTQLRDLRAVAASLARSCGEYPAAAEGMKKLLHAKEDPAGRRVASWWSALWRTCRRQQKLRDNLLDVDVETGDHPKETLDAADVDVTVDVLTKEGTRQLEAASGALLMRARGVIAAADAARVPRGDLSEAADALAQARDPVARLDCVINLGGAAAVVERADSAPLEAVRDRAADLARACRELKEAAKAMARVQRAAAELRGRRGSGVWWSCIFGRRQRRNERREEVLEGGAAAAARRRSSLFTVRRTGHQGQT